MTRIITNNPNETAKFGYQLGKLLKAGDIICLTGDLGAGKTTLTKAIAEGLDVNEYVTSPTFTIIHQYQGRYPVYHFDVYRLESVDEIYDLGYEEYFYSEGVTIIEWANLIEEILPNNRLTIKIFRGKEENKRELIITGMGERYQEIVKELTKG